MGFRPSLAWFARFARPLCIGGHDVYALALAVERDNAVGQCEQGVVLAAADVVAGEVARAALADDDAAGENRFAPVHLDAEALAVRLAAVADGALSLLMSHVSFLEVGWISQEAGA